MKFGDQQLIKTVSLTKTKKNQT